MEQIEKTVFISYRRTNVAWALAIFQNLKQHGHDVFFDYSGIASGDFESVILENINARAHFLVLLTPSALERCDDPADWLRREIEAALASRRNIVPVTLEGFDFSTPAIAGKLTGGLGALKQYNSVRIPPDYFDEAMERLRSRYLNVPLNAVLHPASIQAQQAATEQKAAADAAPEVQQEELTALQWFERAVTATDDDEKLRCYTEAIRLNPDYEAAFDARGKLRSDRGDEEGARQDALESIRLLRGTAAAVQWFALGMIALEKFTKGKDLRNYTPSGRQDKNLDEALRCLNEALRIKPDKALYLVRRGFVLHLKGDEEGALKDAKEAFRLGNKDEGEKPNGKPRDAVLERTLTGHQGWIWSLAVSSDGTWAVSGSRDRTVKIWSLDVGECRLTLTGHTDEVLSVAIMEGRTQILSGSKDSSIRIWHAADGGSIASWPANDFVLSVVPTSDGRVITCGAGRDPTIKIWDPASRKCLKILKGHTEAVKSLAVSNNGRRAVSGSYDATVRLWDLEKGKCLATLKGHSGHVNSVTITADALFAVSGSNDTTIKIWDLEAKTCVATLAGHKKPVQSVAISADGTLLASAGLLDQTVRLWDRKTHSFQVIEYEVTDCPLSVALSPDGLRLVVGTAQSAALFVYRITNDVTLAPSS
jgi:WD40 repeat protein